MSGFSAYILKHIGAFVRWAFGGFKDNFETLLNGENPGTTFNNDVINIVLALGVLFSLLISIGLLYERFAN